MCRDTCGSCRGICQSLIGSATTLAWQAQQCLSRLYTWLYLNRRVPMNNTLLAISCFIKHGSDHGNGLPRGRRFAVQGSHDQLPPPRRSPAGGVTGIAHCGSPHLRLVILWIASFTLVIRTHRLSGQTNGQSRRNKVISALKQSRFPPSLHGGPARHSECWDVHHVLR
jgi:hypothetical protein